MTDTVTSVGFNRQGFNKLGFGVHHAGPGQPQQPASVQLTLTWHDEQGTHQVQASGVMAVTIVHLS